MLMNRISFYSRLYAIVACAVCFTSSVSAQEHAAEVIVDGLVNPWSLVFLPNGDALVTEKIGRLRLLQNGKLNATPVAGLPKITARGQGGLMGIALHPDYAKNNKLCLSYVGTDNQGASTEVLCATFDGQALSNVQTVFVANPRSSRQKHFGGRLAFDKDGLLYITLGDRGERASAQNNAMHNGTLVRTNVDGTSPVANPFVNNDNAQPQIFSTGHRNIQGIAIHPSTGAIWTNEHGPQGGDEVNVARAGKNYGWPIITYGVNYGFGTKIGEGTAKAGLEQPIHKWVPSIAPAGMMFYRGTRYPGWQGHVFIGSLKFGELVRLEFDGEQLKEEQRYFDGEYGRIRDVSEGPDGHIYFLTDARNGKLMRMVAR